MITKDEILVELDHDTVSFRDGDGDWFEGIDSKDFDNTADRLVKLFNTPNVSNQKKLLLAFSEYWNGCKNYLIKESNIDEFLKSKY